MHWFARPRIKKVAIFKAPESLMRLKEYAGMIDKTGIESQGTPKHLACSINQKDDERATKNETRIVKDITKPLLTSYIVMLRVPLTSGTDPAILVTGLLR